MSVSCSFRVPGEPVPQPRPKVSTRGGFARAYVDRNHPIHAYRESVALAARLAKVPLTSGDVVVDVEFVFERPKSHLTKTGLSSTARPRPGPDVDNLYKGLADALHGVAFHDDSQVVRASQTKRYAPRGMPAVTLVTLTYLGGLHGETEAAVGRGNGSGRANVGKRCVTG